MMRKNKLKYIWWIILIVGIQQATSAFAASYPLEVVFVNREAARYDTPENAYTSMISALINEDIDWYYAASTVQSAEREAALYKENGVDLQLIYNSVKNIKQINIVDKKDYNDRVWLIVETINTDGSVFTGPSLFVHENGMWKSHQESIADDNPILDYLYYVPPLFHGKGQKPEDVNSFLGYLQPTQAQTEMQPDTTHYNIHIYYGRTINPETFKAELNKQDITEQFSPTPLTDQEVEISLQKGRNVLILSTEGVRKDGKKANDKDRLVFIVP